MPKLTVDGVGSFDVPANKRLVNALTDDSKIDQMHACGGFAGCISATANLNADLCGRAYHHGDEAAHKTAVAIRGLFDGLPLVPGIKALLAHIHGDAKLAETLPPLAPFPAETARTVIAKYESLRQKTEALQPA